MNTSRPAAQSAELPLILAAIELFGRDGFAAVSTRALCEHAGANLSSIKYHFGGKEDLYKAAVVYVVSQLKPRIEFALSTFEQGRDLAGTDPLLQAKLIKQLVKNLLQLFLGSDDIPQFIPFVLREFFVPGRHFSIFYEAFPRHLHELFAQMVAMVEGTEPDAEETIIRAHSVVGQIMIFHVGRAVLFKRLGWQEFTPSRIETITIEAQSLVLRALQLADPDGQDTR